MDEELQSYQPEPKISDVEIILIGLFYIVLDFIDFIPGAGDITDIIVAPMGFYYWMKGLNGVTFIVSEIIEAVPGLQEFPFIRSITWGLTIWFDRHPAIEGKLATAIAVADAIEGGAPPEGGGIAAPPQGQTLEMTQTAEGEYAYQPEGQGAGDARPSETSTEEGSKEREKEEKRQRSGPGQQEAMPEEEDATEETEEEKKEEAVEQQYEDFTPEAEKSPIPVLVEKELGSEVSITQKSISQSNRKVVNIDEGREARAKRKEAEVKSDFEKVKPSQPATQDQDSDQDIRRAA